MYGLIAQADHEPPVNHGVVLLAVVLIAAVGALVYGLVRLVGKRRAGEGHRYPRHDQDRTPEA